MCQVMVIHQSLNKPYDSTNIRVSINVQYKVSGQTPSLEGCSCSQQALEGGRTGKGPRDKTAAIFRESWPKARSSEVVPTLAAVPLGLLSQLWHIVPH